MNLSILITKILVKLLVWNARLIEKNPLVTYGVKRELKKLLKEIPLFFNHLEGSSQLRRGCLKKKIARFKKVQVGGGKHTLSGFLNIDILPPADLIYDVREGLPLEDESVEFIFNEHFLEHIDYPRSVKKFVKECYRVLRPKGKLVIGVPDSELVIKKYLERDRRFYKEMIKRWYAKRDCIDHFNTYIDLVNYHFRDQDDSDKYTPHLWSYDFEKLEDLLKSVGFSEVKKWRFDSSIANPERKWGSLYIVAIK